MQKRCDMIINNVGFNHCHDSDFFIYRPHGSGDYLLLLLKTDALFTLNGKDVPVPRKSFFIYRKDTPQYYRCSPQQTFSNDWVHFLFESKKEEEDFLSLEIPFETPIKIDNIFFLSFCIKSLAYEKFSNNLHSHDSISKYMFLLFNKTSEQLSKSYPLISHTHYEMLSTIRNKIYCKPYERRTIESAAHEVRMSRSNFQHQYKKYFGVTFIQDLINSRIEYSQMLLLSTSMDMTNIARLCGYKHYVHYTRQFKEKIHMTPLEFRKKNLDANTNNFSLKH